MISRVRDIFWDDNAFGYSLPCAKGRSILIKRNSIFKVQLGGENQLR